MKKIIFLGLVVMGLFSQSVGRYSIDSDLYELNYIVYFNGFPYSSPITNEGISFTGNIKQGVNTIVIIPNENISNLSIRMSSDMDGNNFGTNWNLKLTNGIARTLTVNLENYGFNNAWESGDSFNNLTTADKNSISNIMDKYIDILENEKIGNEYSSFFSNENKYSMEVTMAMHGGITIDRAITMLRYFDTNTYMGNKRREFKKHQDYKITVSPYNNKIIILESKNNPYVVLMGSTLSVPSFSIDYKKKYFTFFKKDGQWWMY